MKKYRAAIVSQGALINQDGKFISPVLVFSTRFGFTKNIKSEEEQIAKLEAGIQSIASSIDKVTLFVDAGGLNVHNVRAVRGDSFPMEKIKAEVLSISKEWNEKVQHVLEPIREKIEKNLLWDELFEKLEMEQGVTKEELIEIVKTYYFVNDKFKLDVDEPVIKRMYAVIEDARKNGKNYHDNPQQLIEKFTDYVIEECAGVLAIRFLGQLKSLMYLGRLNLATAHIAKAELCVYLSELLAEKEKLCNIMTKIDQNVLGCIEVNYSIITIDPKKNTPQQQALAENFFKKNKNMPRVAPPEEKNSVSEHNITLSNSMRRECDIDFPRGSQKFSASSNPKLAYGNNASDKIGVNEPDAVVVRPVVPPFNIRIEATKALFESVNEKDTQNTLDLKVMLFEKLAAKANQAPDNRAISNTTTSEAIKGATPNSNGTRNSTFSVTD